MFHSFQPQMPQSKINPMVYRLRTLIASMWMRAFAWTRPRGRCSYCGQDGQRLWGSKGPLGNRVSEVCFDCAQACISLTK